jgi:hypothetical protein
MIMSDNATLMCRHIHVTKVRQVTKRSRRTDCGLFSLRYIFGCFVTKPFLVVT